MVGVIMRFALLNKVEVANVIIAEDLATAQSCAPSGFTAIACPQIVGPGWTLINDTWTPPVPIIPAPRDINAEIAALQARIAELQAEGE